MYLTTDHDPHLLTFPDLLSTAKGKGKKKKNEEVGYNLALAKR